MTVVTGVSGSGKSTLINDILYRALAAKLYRSMEKPGAHRAITGIEHIDKVVQIDQAPIGRTPRSNPATYTGVFAPIRELYAMLPESRERGYRPGRFSFNVKGGRCEACQGDGQRRIEMNFLPDVYVTCEVCRGKRYNAETLAVRYKGLSISDLLEMPIEEALKVLENIPAIQIKLQTLVDVGLGYVQLGQSATTISGGEAQRTKLARELSKRQTGRTLYILDEPTTGLHFDDVKKLLDVLNRLVTLGNTVLIIEHNLDVIKQADWIIDLGPEGGEEGGRIVAQGSPEQVARVKKSYTGQILRSRPQRQRHKLPWRKRRKQEALGGAVAEAREFILVGTGAACESAYRAIHPENRQRRFEGLRPSSPGRQHLDAWRRMKYIERGLARTLSNDLRRLQSSAAGRRARPRANVRIPQPTYGGLHHARLSGRL